MNTREIQRVLITIHRLERSASPDAFFESWGLKYVKPALGRTALRLASFTHKEQEQIEAYVERLFNEARALCLRLQDRCPMVREGETDRDVLYELERFYKLQYRAMERLGRRKDDWQWVHAHIRKARRWLEQPRVGSVN